MIVVYIVRARGLRSLKLKLSPWFSVYLVPFFGLWLLNLGLGGDFGRLVAELAFIQLASVSKKGGGMRCVLHFIVFSGGQLFR